jgi:hypothetical protein
MEDIKIYKTKDLVLQVNPNYDPAKLNLDEWECFFRQALRRQGISKRVH